MNKNNYIIKQNGIGYNAYIFCNSINNFNEEIKDFEEKGYEYGKHYTFDTFTNTTSTIDYLLNQLNN